MKCKQDSSILIRLTLILSFCFTALCLSSFGQLAPTPPMGWMSWNQFEGDINEQIVREIADAMVESGMAAAGYTLLSIDDHWEGGRTEDGYLFPNPEKFPNGMKAVGDYLHSKGLKFGIYTDIAEFTCGGEVGSLGYEEKDAQIFADWGVDFIKCDYCGAPPDLWTAIERYEKFIKAVRASNRDMVFAICEWGQRAPWLWGDKVDGNMWRTTFDSRDTWESHKYSNGAAGIMEILDRQLDLWKYAKPGRWNDPDMLMIGLNGKGKSSNAGGAKGCSTTEYESQMSLWCLLSAPLLTCHDVRSMDSETKRILLNKEIIAINQDPLGTQAKRLWKDGESEIWGKRLENGDWAIGFLNRNHDEDQEISLDLSLLRIKGAVKARNVWDHQDIGAFGNRITIWVKPHQTKVLRLSSI